MNAYFADSTKESVALLKLAQNLTQQCPLEFGAEIIVSGSVGWGCADIHSDLDIEFIGQTLPSLESVLEWLATIGAANLIPESESNEALNISCRYEGVWVEVSWREIFRKEKLIHSVISGQDTSHLSLLQMGNLSKAIPLRTSGALEKWQQALSVYPDEVQEQVILNASSFWTFPHRVEMLWVLAQRQEVMGLTIWLTADVSDALRILFAINRQWEMDWKHLLATSQRLAIKPSKMMARIEELFSAQQLKRRVAVTQQLIIDILQLVPSTLDVTKAKANIERSLEMNVNQE